MSAPVTVLDLGSTKAVCLVAETTESGGLRVLAVNQTPCTGVKKGVVVDLDETARAISEVVRQSQTAAGVEMSPIIVGAGGTHMEGMNAQGFVPIVPQARTITRDDVLQVVNHSRQLMMPPDREQVQALPREFKVNGQRGISKPVGMSGGKLEVVTYVVTGQTPHLQNLERAVTMAGRKIDSIVLQALASGLGVLGGQEMELGTAVVDIGGDTTDLAVFAGGSIAYHCTIPVGGKHVTTDVSTLLKCSPEEAERLKLRYGAAVSDHVPEGDQIDVLQIGASDPRPMQRKVFCEIVESRMKELATMIRQNIEKSGYYAMLPGGVSITGGGSQLSATDRLFEQALPHIRVRCANPKVEGPLRTSVMKPEMATAAGLARYALDEGDDEFATEGESNWRERIKTMWSLFSK